MAEGGGGGGDEAAATAHRARPNGHQRYGRGELGAAVKAYLSKGNNASYKQLSETFDVPATTIRDHAAAEVTGKGPVASVGRPRRLAADDEAALVQWVNDHASVYIPATKIEILQRAAMLVTARGGEPFKTKSGLPGRSWWKGFRDRADLKCKHVKRVEPGRPTRAGYEEWLNDFAVCLARHSITPDRIYNADESGIDRRYGGRAHVVVGKDKTPVVVAKRNTVRKHMTVVVAICADGTFLPPCWIVAGKAPVSDKTAAKMLMGTMLGSTVVTTAKGWIEFESWSQWLQFFVASLPKPPTKDEPVLLLLDGHQTRYSVRCVEYATNMHVILFLLPPHMTAYLQPLDAGIYGPFKVVLHEVLHDAEKKDGVNRTTIVGLCDGVLAQVLTETNIKKAWEKVGLVPIDGSRLPSTAFATPRSAVQSIPSSSSSSTSSSNASSSSSSSSSLSSFSSSSSSRIPAHALNVPSVWRPAPPRELSNLRWSSIPHPILPLPELRAGLRGKEWSGSVPLTGDGKTEQKQETDTVKKGGMLTLGALTKRIRDKEQRKRAEKEEKQLAKRVKVAEKAMEREAKQRKKARLERREGRRKKTKKMIESLQKKHDKLEEALEKEIKKPLRQVKRGERADKRTNEREKAVKKRREALANVEEELQGYIDLHNDDLRENTDSNLSSAGENDQDGSEGEEGGRGGGEEEDGEMRMEMKSDVAVKDVAGSQQLSCEMAAHLTEKQEVQRREAKNPTHNFNLSSLPSLLVPSPLVAPAAVAIPLSISSSSTSSSSVLLSSTSSPSSFSLMSIPPVLVASPPSVAAPAALSSSAPSLSSPSAPSRLSSPLSLSSSSSLSRSHSSTLRRAPPRAASRLAAAVRRIQHQDSSGSDSDSSSTTTTSEEDTDRERSEDDDD